MTVFDQSTPPGKPTTGESLPDPLPTDPMPLFRRWFDDAQAARQQPNPNAMALATVDKTGHPSVRIVLCKAIHEDPGFIVFYTNYVGRKGLELAQTPRAAVCFHWDHADRQIRIEGPITKSPPEESDAYYRSRPWQSRLGAWVSDQSMPIASRELLLAKVDEQMKRFGLDRMTDEERARAHIPRPEHWGGYRLWAERVESWCAGVGRLHDRASWTRSIQPADDPALARTTPWLTTRLQP